MPVFLIYFVLYLFFCFVFFFRVSPEGTVGLRLLLFPPPLLRDILDLFIAAAEPLQFHMLASWSDSSKSCSIVALSGHRWNFFRCPVITAVSSALQTARDDVLEAVSSMALTHFPTREKVDTVKVGEAGRGSSAADMSGSLPLS